MAWTLFGFENEKLLISFSGGRTSGYMLYYLWFEWPERDIWDMKVVFANTGKEQEGTLEFVHRCGREWNIPITWVEGYPSEKGKGWSVLHKEVDFLTASRNGEPFEAMIARLGIPSAGNVPFCSDQMKRLAIESYLKSIGWRDFYKAIGIRYDEVDRVNENYFALQIKYPLIDTFITKRWINDWWSGQTFNLHIDPDLGNCDGCLKKNLITLCNIARKKPEAFDWWKEMTTKYGQLNPRDTPLKPPFNFYRSNLSPWDIIELSKFPDAEIKERAKAHRLDGSSESCEAY